MVEITDHKNKITIDGHANYAPIGRDIVCAAVSVLAQNLICSIEELTTDKIKYDFRPGWVEIKHGILSERGLLLRESFFIGIQAIADEYPGFVRVV